MSNTRNYDVVVVGAGNAALCAAISAKEGGARVLVLERGPLESVEGTLSSRMEPFVLPTII